MPLDVEGLDGVRRPEVPARVVADAIAHHRVNASHGREACENWGPGSSVSRVRLEDEDGASHDLAVKWNHPRGLRRAVAEHLRGSRAARAARGARELERAAIAHPRTLAVAEVRRLGRVHESFLLTRFLADALPLPAAAPALRADRARRRRVVRALGDLIGRLHAAGLDHRDLKHSNLLLRGGGSFALLDLDSLVPPRRPGLRARARALGQLEAYARDLTPWLPPSDRARFLAAYLAQEPAWRGRRRRLLAEAGRWADRRLERWSREDRSDHYHFPMAPRGAPGPRR